MAKLEITPMGKEYLQFETYGKEIGFNFSQNGIHPKETRY